MVLEAGVTGLEPTPAPFERGAGLGIVPYLGQPGPDGLACGGPGQERFSPLVLALDPVQRLGVVGVLQPTVWIGNALAMVIVDLLATRGGNARQRPHRANLPDSGTGSTTPRRVLAPLFAHLRNVGISLEMAAACRLLLMGARSRWKPWLTVALLLGLISGIVLTAAAGARRTETAFPRLLQADKAANVLVSPQNLGSPALFGAISRLPEVTSLAWVRILDMFLLDRSGKPVTTGPAPGAPALFAAAPVDGRFGTSVDRVKVLRGTMYSPDDADEVMVGPQVAQRYHLRPGNHLRLLDVPIGANGEPEVSRARHLSFRVTAVVVFDSQIVPVSATDQAPEILLTKAFADKDAPLPTVSADGAYVRLRQGASVAAFDRQANQLSMRYATATIGGPLFEADLSDQRAKVEHAIMPEATALWLFAIIVGLIGLALAGQLASRQHAIAAPELKLMQALGATRGQLLALMAVRTVVATVVGALLGLVAALAASPLTPIGPARLAEPAPGFAVNLVVLGAGLAGTMLLPVLVVLPAAWRLAQRAAGGPNPSVATLAGGRLGVTGALGTVRGPVSLVTGVRMAFGPRSGGAGPVGSALAATTLALGALMASLVFGSSLDRLVGTPRLYGQTWQLEFQLGFGAAPKQLVQPVLLATDPRGAYSGGRYGELSIGNQTVPAIGIDPIKGDVAPLLLRGRRPRNGHEIVLGARTLASLDKQMGDTVTVRYSGVRRTMRIVGEAVFPAFGLGTFTPTSLGEGAELTGEPLAAGTAGEGCPRGASCYNFFLIRFPPAAQVDAASRALATFAGSLGCPPGACVPVADQRPADIQNYERVRDTPLVLGALLGFLSLATLAHVLVTSARRGRRDLAVLKALGLTRRQVAATVAWQATALAVAALVIGTPLGVVAGKLAWAAFATSLGVPTGADIPVFAVLATVAGALLAANALAAGPGLAASWAPPAEALRSE